MKEYQLRELASLVYFTMTDDLKWYLRRGGEHRETLREFVSLWSTLMNPLTPHLSEELNVLMGGEKLVSAGSWPQFAEEKINLKALAGEELIQTAMNGMRNVLKLAKIETPKKFRLFVSEKWLYPLFLIISKELKVTRDIGEIMKKVLEGEEVNEEIKAHSKEVSRVVVSLIKDPAKIPTLITSQEEELKSLQEAQEFLAKEFGCKVEIIPGEESEEAKAKSAIPGKVGILVE